MNLEACAEYLIPPQTNVVRKPANLTHVEAASLLQGGLTALYFLRKSGIQPGEKVLILGACGGVGLHSVQIVKKL
jgi:NADPH:quinone reductase-like Zn-dependent oxidoreductase